MKKAPSHRRDPARIAADNAPDIAEPILDAGAESLGKELFGVALPEFAHEVPLIRTAVAAADMYSYLRFRRLRARMRQFLDGLIAQQFRIEDYLALDARERQLVIDILVTELDSHTHDGQSQALSLLFGSYIRGDISRSMFHGVSHELKYVNPLVFQGDVAAFIRKAPVPAGVRIEGQLHYLPSTFYSNSTEILSFSSDNWLTDLGAVFFEQIYDHLSNHS